MAKSLPVGVAQEKVLSALSLNAETWQEANSKFDALGITVAARREGRTSVPLIYRKECSGGFNSYGEGEDGYTLGAITREQLQKISQWMAE